MTKNYRILAQFIKDMSSETPDVETYMFVKDNISNYNLGININSKALKTRMVEVDTAIKFDSKDTNVKNQFLSLFILLLYKLMKNLQIKKFFEKIILVDVQKDIYPNLEKALLRCSS